MGAVIDRVTERDMLDCLAVRYGVRAKNGTWTGPKYARAEHVPNRLQNRRGRIADFIAVAVNGYHEYLPGNYGAGLHVEPPLFHGHEVKVSRSDWLAELADPLKAEAFRKHMHFWWLVASETSIVRDDLPEGWGLMVKHGRTTRIVAQAPLLDPEPMPHGLTGALMRAIATTEARHAPTREDTP